MPRDVFDIKTFHQGIVSGIDEEDIPKEAASDSLNIDGDVGQGILQGIPVDTEFTTSGSASIGNIGLGEFIEKDTDYDLIYHDSSANKIKTIIDFEGSKFVRDLVTANVSDNSCIVPNNKEVHIGTGSGINNESKWVGHCEFGQFNGGTSWAISTASNATPIVITAAGHTLKDGNLVKISGVATNTAANGIWIVASSSPSAGTFALTSSVGNGAGTGGTAYQHLCVEDARLEHYTGTADGQFGISEAETEGSGTKYFVTTTTYYWAMSYVYDGYQESPLTRSSSVSWTISDVTDDTVSPIVVTAAGNAIEEYDVVKISGVTGNTAANGIWMARNVNNGAGTFELYTSIGMLPSTGDGDYVSGGTVEIFFTRNPFTGTGFIDDIPAQNSEYYTLTLTAYGGGDNEDEFNKRITGINIYRAEEDSTSTSRGLFRLVSFVDINDSKWCEPAAPNGNKYIFVKDYGMGSAIGGSVYATPTYKDIVNYGSVTYEQNSGIAENLDNTIVNYSLACKGEGYLFAGKGYKIDLPNADRYIFRSKELRYDMFDWINDFVIIPEPITAMSYNNGRLFAFSLNKVYRIHPEMYIEDVFEGAGAFGQRSVLLTEYGMFFANQAGAYWMDNTGRIDIISKPIQRSLTSGRSWRTFEFDYNIIIAYSSAKKYVMFMNSYDASGASYLSCWAYNVLSKRWDYWTFSNNYLVTENTGSFTDKNGKVYYSSNTKTYELLAHGSNKTLWEWYSQDITFGETRQDKKLVKIILDVTGTVTINYGINGATPATGYTNDTYINTKIMSVKIKLNAAAGTQSVDSLEVIYRPLIGKR